MTGMDLPVTIDVYDKEKRWQGTVGAPEAFTITPRFNAQGSASLELAPNDKMCSILVQPGARVTFTYLGEHVLSGMVRDPEGPWVERGGRMIFQISDDWRRLPNTLAWVNPSRPLGATSLTDVAQSWQTKPAGPAGTITGRSGYYQWPTNLDSAEAAIKHLIGVQLGRLPYTPLDIRPNLGRGGNPYASAELLPDLRFLTLADALAPILAWSELGLRIWQDGRNPQFSVDVWEPRVWPQALTQESGAIVDGKFRLSNPLATRVVVGGPGEDTARAFWDGGANPLREADYADVIEVFTDATGASLEWPDTITEAEQVAIYYLLRSEVAAADKATFRRYLQAAADKALAEGNPVAGVELELAETPAFHYGGPTGYHVGDIVTTSARGLTVSERIGSATLSLGQDGFKIKPTVGEFIDSRRATIRALVKLATKIRTFSSSR